MLQHLLFPQLNGKWAEVNLNEIALKHNLDAGAPSDLESHWVEALHKSMGVDYSYGGWMEHRDFLLRTYYMKDVGPDHFWHLGIDYTVPLYTEVHLPVDAELIHCINNGDQSGGWGGMQIYKVADFYLVLGHLDDHCGDASWQGHRSRPLGHYKKGYSVARVGPRETNGGWFPHLHVQCARVFNPDMDGYSHRYEGIELDYPNPEKMLCTPSA